MSARTGRAGLNTQKARPPAKGAGRRKPGVKTKIDIEKNRCGFPRLDCKARPLAGERAGAPPAVKSDERQRREFPAKPVDPAFYLCQLGVGNRGPASFVLAQQAGIYA